MSSKFDNFDNFDNFFFFFFFAVSLTFTSQSSGICDKLNNVIFFRRKENMKTEMFQVDTFFANLPEIGSP